MYKTPGRGLSITTEVVNNTINNIVATNLGIGAEFTVVSNHDEVINFSMKNRILIRVNIDGDPRKINFLEGEPCNSFDRYVREKLIEKINSQLYPDKAKPEDANYFEMIDDRKHYECHFQIDVYMNELNPGDTFESRMLSIHVRREDNPECKPMLATPEADIRKAFIPEIADRESEADGGVDQGIRTISAVRLVDKGNLIGDLWANVFGHPTSVKAVRESPLADGLYIASGYCFEHVHFVPLEDLMQDAKLIHFGLFKTKKEAYHNSVGDYVKSVISDNADLNKRLGVVCKENKTLTDTNTNLDKKVRDLDTELRTVKGEMKAKVTSLESSKARAIDDLKSQNAHLSKVMDTMKTDHRREMSETIARYDWDRRKTMERHEQEIKRLKENSIVDLLGNVGRVLAGLVATATGIMRLASVFKIM